jgi:type 2A phosphatase activator TIP41
MEESASACAAADDGGGGDDDDNNRNGFLNERERCPLIPPSSCTSTFTAVMMQVPDHPNSVSSTISDSFSVEGWTVVSSKGPIMSSEEVQKAETLLSLKMPEMVFGQNAIELHHTGANVRLRFDAIRALSCVASEPWLQVAGAEQWAGASALEVKEAGKIGSEPAPTYDWTYSSAFPGALRPEPHDWTVSSSDALTTASERGGCLAGSRSTTQQMNVDLLQPRGDCPILFHDEVLLYQVIP